MAAPDAVDRPQMPDGYGVPTDDGGLLAWSDVDERLGEAQHYWLATVRADGRPHVVPRWGAWIDGLLWYDGSPDTIHARNLLTNPACTLTIGDGAEAIVVEGTSGASAPLGADRGAPIAAEIGRKYGEAGYAPEADAWSGPDAGGLCVFRPDKALCWFSFPTDVTRFRFDHDG